MKSSKFTVNSLLIVIIIISAIGFFVTVTMTRMADRAAINEIVEIEGTDLSVRYSSLEKNGIYKGDENTGSLMLEGAGRLKGKTGVFLLTNILPQASALCFRIWL